MLHSAKAGEYRLPLSQSATGKSASPNDVGSPIMVLCVVMMSWSTISVHQI